ncbi:hypothetical protein BG011_006564 [Mortierella polycephala]|uniref:Uncharacterized protein n=1 Tax=Mortierella polycephala TaxID=41804 RepID=A0A9P6U806_9FUNG|nr:hypothetical protein BG011_006564 [Mortierella polycephala]
MARSLSFDIADDGPKPSLSSSTFSSSSSSRLSNLTTTDIVLIVILSLVVLVALASLYLCLRMKRKQKAQSSPRAIPLQHDGQDLHLPAQLQQSTIPLHQPPETPPTLSSFTRISSRGPEMSSVLSGGLQRHPSTSSASGFSLARFFSKHSSPSTPAKAGRDVYLHNSRSSQYIVDMSSQKTPSVTSSTRSSSRDYTWDLSLPSKEGSKGMFPIITLTSPTNSEASIAIPLQEEPQAAFINSDIEPSTSSFGLQPNATISLGVMEQRDASSSIILQSVSVAAIRATTHAASSISIVQQTYSTVRETTTIVTLINTDGFPTNL